MLRNVDGRGTVLAASRRTTSLHQATATHQRPSSASASAQPRQVHARADLRSIAQVPSLAPELPASSSSEEEEEEEVARERSWPPPPPPLPGRLRGTTQAMQWEEPSPPRPEALVHLPRTVGTFSLPQGCPQPPPRMMRMEQVAPPASAPPELLGREGRALYSNRPASAARWMRQRDASTSGFHVAT